MEIRRHWFSKENCAGNTRSSVMAAIGNSDNRGAKKKVYHRPEIRVIRGASPDSG